MEKRELRELGLELKRERESRNINLETIADKTKINIKFLKSIEEGKFDFLPDTYVRNFFKLYLQQLGGNTQKYLTKYDTITTIDQHPIISDESLRKSSIENNRLTFRFLSIDNIKKFKKRYLSILSGVVIILILIATIILSGNEEEQSTDKVIYNEASTEKNSQLASFSSFLFSYKRLNLKLIARERTWMQIAIDDSAAQEYIFEKGDSTTWSAKEKFFLRIGNGRGIKLYLNGNDLGHLGQKHEIINLLLTKDEVRRYNF